MHAVSLQESTFTVTSTADTAHGFCGADCTLRDAIIAANSSPGHDTIAFNIPGDGVHVIQPTLAESVDCG